MNLASRCREAISHVAMLKKELAMQQKRTSQALASQREQTRRMTDSLTNSFITFSSPESADRKSQQNNSIEKSKSQRVGQDEDDNMMRLVSSTPSPDRVDLRQRNNNNVEKHKENVKSTTITTRPSSPTKEIRDSPATTATNSPYSDSADSDSTPGRNSEDENDKDEKKELYSTPKKSLRSQSPAFQGVPVDDDPIFPFSASPHAFSKSNSNRGSSSYDEEFPPDTIEQPESSGNAKYAKPDRKLSLMNSIDAFEQSFSTDFPDSFTPKESNSVSPPSESVQNIYNPFFATPEKKTGKKNSFVYSTPEEGKRNLKPTADIGIECAENVPMTVSGNTSSGEPLPKRPEKVTPSAARARYEKALHPRIDTTNSSMNGAIKDIEKGSSSETNKNPTALVRRIQQKKRLDMNLESMSKGNGPVVESPTRKSIIDIVDTFEHSVIEDVDSGKDQKSPSRFQGPIRSLRRRSVKQPISYAEPALNTKLRRGDTFFPKTGPEVTDGGAKTDSQRKAMSGVTSAAIVSP
ncbi:unnamed protein product [Pseudo-nitzschia multistriata]|nr:unnamed protein product [Pseudo-nitzschia multistriata]